MVLGQYVLDIKRRLHQAFDIVYETSPIFSHSVRGPLIVFLFLHLKRRNDIDPVTLECLDYCSSMLKRCFCLWSRDVSEVVMRSP